MPNNTRILTGHELCSATSRHSSSSTCQTARMMSSGVRKFNPSVLVWGGMTARGLTPLHIIPDKTSVNATYYINEILEKEVKPAFRRTKTCTDLTETKPTTEYFKDYN